MFSAFNATQHAGVQSDQEEIKSNPTIPSILLLEIVGQFMATINLYILPVSIEKDLQLRGTINEAQFHWLYDRLH